MIKVCPNKLMQYANRECNAIMTIAKCTNTAASSNDSSHHSSTPATWFASGTAYHGRRYQNLGSWTSWRSYTIVDSKPSLENGYRHQSRDEGNMKAWRQTETLLSLRQRGKNMLNKENLQTDIYYKK